MDILRYTHVFFMIVVWAYIFIYIKPYRIKDLMPVGLLAAIVFFAAEQFLVTMGLYRFNNPLAGIMGIPLFLLLWGAGSGIIFMNYMKNKFAWQIPIIVFFTLLTQGFEYLAEYAGVASHIGGFTEVHHFFVNFCVLVLLQWISAGLFGRRIFRERSLLF